MPVCCTIRGSGKLETERNRLAVEADEAHRALRALLEVEP